jgi:hypothetical protein
MVQAPAFRPRCTARSDASADSQVDSLDSGEWRSTVYLSERALSTKRPIRAWREDLQNRIHGFDSRRRLHLLKHENAPNGRLSEGRSNVLTAKLTAYLSTICSDLTLPGVGSCCRLHHASAPG